MRDGSVVVEPTGLNFHVSANDLARSKHMLRLTSRKAEIEILHRVLRAMAVLTGNKTRQGEGDEKGATGGAVGFDRRARGWVGVR